MNPPLVIGFLCGAIAGLILGFVMWAPRERRVAPRIQTGHPEDRKTPPIEESE